MTHTITVCSACLMASCWQGKFMCNKARSASTVERTRGELTALGLEHPSWWDICREHGVAITTCGCLG